MSILITNPAGTPSVAGLNQPMLLEAEVAAPSTEANLQWSASVNGGAYSVFTTGSLQAVYTTPSSVTNADGSGNLGVDTVTIRCEDPTSGHPPDSSETVITVVSGIPKLNHTNPQGDPTTGTPNPGPTPMDNPHPGGIADATVPTEPEDQDNQTEHKCDTVNYTPCEADEGGDTKCNPPPGEPNNYDNVNIPGVGSVTNLGLATGAATMAGILNPEPMYCPTTMVAGGSSYHTTLAGTLQAIHGWVPLVTRGVTLDLGVYTTQTPDGLTVSVERPAGLGRSFGWQVRLIKDTAGNAAIYWGDRRVESWPSSDGGATFQSSRGSFGTLTKQGDGSFTRLTKAGVYYDFDSSGRLFQLKDRSTNGNPVYYHYNASPLPVRITGPGMGLKPYFSYDGSNRVTRMTLEGPGAGLERETYYRYDASGRMTVLQQPEGVVSYFDYDGVGNLAKAIDPEGKTTYFWYTADSPPRITRLLQPENSGTYFKYEDVIPRTTRVQVASGIAGPGFRMPSPGSRTSNTTRAATAQRCSILSGTPPRAASMC